MGFPREGKMLVPERGATLQVIGDDVIDEEVVHGSPVYFFGAAVLASTSVAIIL